MSKTETGQINNKSRKTMSKLEAETKGANGAITAQTAILIETIREAKKEITKATDITIEYRLQEMEHKRQEKIRQAKAQALMEDEQRRTKQEQAKMQAHIKRLEDAFKAKSGDSSNQNSEAQN